MHLPDSVGLLNRNIITLDHWDIEILEHWNMETLEHRNIGTFEHCNIGTLEHWNIGTLEHWNIRSLDHWRELWQVTESKVGMDCFYLLFILFVSLVVCLTSVECRASSAARKM